VSLRDLYQAHDLTKINFPVGGVGELSYGCTGGRQEERCKCFNLRPMWRCITVTLSRFELRLPGCRPQSVGELYAYLPLTQGNSSRLLAVPPASKANADYGFSVGRGSFHLGIAVGQWVTIAFRIKLNDHGAENGDTSTPPTLS
jgi:hypothetical protein